MLVQQLVPNEPKWPPPAAAVSRPEQRAAPGAEKLGERKDQRGLDLNGAH